MYDPRLSREIEVTERERLLALLIRAFYELHKTAKGHESRSEFINELRNAVRAAGWELPSMEAKIFMRKVLRMK